MIILPARLTMQRSLFLLIAIFSLFGCKPATEKLRGTPLELSEIQSGGEKHFTAGDVVLWAQLDDYFRDRTAKIEVGQADGKAILGRLVLLENAADAAEFMRVHGCIDIRGPVGVRQLPAALEVEVEVTGKDGKKLILILKSDGNPAGEG
jgi:hypothetical protein